MTMPDQATIIFDYGKMSNDDRNRLKTIENKFTEMGIMFDTYTVKGTRYWILKTNDKITVEN